MNGERLFVATILAITISVVGCHGKQAFIPNNTVITAATVFPMRPDGGNEDLYDVTMLFDYIYDPSIGGMQNYWNSPYQFSLYPNYWKKFLEQTGPLGVDGPLGPAGPLSLWGPIGANDTTTFTYDNGSCSWCISMISWFSSMGVDVAGGVLGPNGPLGQNGPITGYEVYNVMYHLNEVPYGANDFPVNLDIIGVWGILGPLSVLGPLGPLGALGLLGPVAVQCDLKDPSTGKFSGQFYNATTHEIVRNVSVMFDQTNKIVRLYDLVELYTDEFASTMDNNDCSFGVEGKLSKQILSKKYKFGSKYSQMISAIVLPNMNTKGVFTSFSDFDIRIYQLNKKNQFVPIAESNLKSSHNYGSTNAYGYIDWIIYKGLPNHTYQVEVFSTPSGLDSQSTTFRLFVVGTGFLEGGTDKDSFSHQNIFGSHIRQLNLTNTDSTQIPIS